MTTAIFRVVPFLLIFLLGISFNGSAQSTFAHWLKKEANAKVKPFLMVQVWSSYSTQQEVFNDSTQSYLPVDNRFNTLIRRGRFGFKAQPYKNIKTTLAIAYDLIGRDVLSSLVGGSNNGSGPGLRIWDAFIQWKIAPQSEKLHLTAGYFRPQYSRESITSGWNVGSMEKAMSQSYIRQQLVGTNPGRALGINLGGLFQNDLQNFTFHYNLGLFNPLYHTLNGNSVGNPASPLLVSRISLNFGEAEQDQYKIGYTTNYFNERNGITLSMNGAWQGATALFNNAFTFGGDLLLNWGPLNLDGEWHFLNRQISTNQQATAQTGHIRMGINAILYEKYFLEPAFMIMHFRGATEKTAQELAGLLKMSSGTETTFDAGINWYVNKNRLKINLHYTWRKGNPGDAGNGATVNTYFSQSGLGAIRRGNWLGLGFNAIF